MVATTRNMAVEALTSKHQLDHRLKHDYVRLYEGWPEQESGPRGADSEVSARFK